VSDQKTPAAKMRMTPGMSVTLLHAPDGIESLLGIADDVTRVEDPAAADFVLVFARTQAEAEERLSALAPSVGPKTLAWLAYPKGSRAAGHDMSRDTVWRFAETIGLRLVANVAIDETWSALRIRPAE
jgi:hypothetical protein